MFINKKYEISDAIVINVRDLDKDEPRVVRIDGDFVQEESEAGLMLRHWFLHCLEVCEVSRREEGRAKVSLEFGGAGVGGRDGRRYSMSEADAEILAQVSRPILEALARHALRLGALQCVKCQTEFTHEGNPSKFTHCGKVR